LPLPSYLLDDIFYFKGTMVWIAANLDQAARRHSMDGYGFTLVDEDDNHPTNRVQYKNRSLWKLDTRTYEVKITDIGERGDGIGKIDGLVIIVPDATPGETVKVRISRVERKVAFGRKV